MQHAEPGAQAAASRAATSAAAATACGACAASASVEEAGRLALCELWGVAVSKHHGMQVVWITQLCSNG